MAPKKLKIFPVFMGRGKIFPGCRIVARGQRLWALINDNLQEPFCDLGAHGGGLTWIQVLQKP